ncbi:MAG: hypothetical protein KA765_02025 [Thermoflexales bacterium]|nr:hypothetical protein [Thermoflexales bacterium]
MKNARTLNQLAALTLIASGVVLVCYVIVLLFPQIPLNPFRPESITLLATLGPTATATSTLPPTWTPTAVASPIGPRATFTPEPTATPRPTRTPTIIPSPTIDPRIPTRSPFKFTNTALVLTSDPYGAACGNWGGVGGQVLNVDGSPLAGVSVVGWGGPIPEQNKKVFVSGSDARINKFYNGDAAYELYIGAPGDFDFNVVVYENGRPASAVVKFRMYNDCARDLALINFQRNH